MRKHPVFRPLSGLAVLYLLCVVALAVPASTYAYDGDDGYDEEDCENSIAYLETRAQMGDAEAQNYLADCYFSGEGVAKDVRRGLELMHKAAEQGLVKAQHNLGALYSRHFVIHGVDIPKNRQEAVKWYRKAAAQGDKQSQEALREWGLSW